MSSEAGRGVAFVLSVGPHRAWTSRKLIEITVRSWPNQGLFVSLNGSHGRDWSEDEHKKLRKAGLTTAAVVNDRHWLSSVTLRMSTALMANRVTREAGKLLRCLRHAIDHPAHVERQLMDNASLNGVAWPAEPAITLRWLRGSDRYGFGIVEVASGATVLVGAP